MQTCINISLRVGLCHVCNWYVVCRKPNRPKNDLPSGDGLKSWNFPPQNRILICKSQAKMYSLCELRQNCEKIYKKSLALAKSTGETN